MVGDRLFPFVRPEEHRAHAALVGDLAALGDQVEPLGHRRVVLGDLIVHFVDQGRHLEGQLDHAGLADLDTFFHRFVLRKEHGVLLVLFDLPAVGRMDLSQVDDEEVDLVAIVLIDLVEGPSLGPKRRSGVTTEDQRNGSLLRPIGEAKGLTLLSAEARQEGKLEIPTGLPLLN